MDVIPVVLVDPNKLFREGLKALFRDGDLSIIGEAAGLADAAGLSDEAGQPGLVLCDTGAGPSAHETVIELRRLFPGARIVMLTMAVDPQAIVSAIQAGVDGCLVKDISPDALRQSLRLVMMGEKVFPTHLAALLISGQMQGGGMSVPASRNGLSPREAEILGRLVNGDSNKMIANRIGITEATVKVHLKSLLRKINASNRTQAAIWALNNGFADDEVSRETA